MSNHHGSKQLQSKFEQIEINVTNKNDLYNIIGPPSSVSDFDDNKWFYFERLKTNQSLIKLGTQKIEKNNVLIVQFNNQGMLNSKKLLDLNDMNDLKHLNTITSKEFKQDNSIYNVFSSLREKINAPARSRNK